jgi:hypothetical protein
MVQGGAFSVFDLDLIANIVTDILPLADEVSVAQVGHQLLGSSHQASLHRVKGGRLRLKK